MPGLDKILVADFYHFRTAVTLTQTGTTNLKENLDNCQFGPCTSKYITKIKQHLLLTLEIIVQMCMRKVHFQAIPLRVPIFPVLFRPLTRLVKSHGPNEPTAKSLTTGEYQPFILSISHRCLSGLLIPCSLFGYISLSGHVPLVFSFVLNAAAKYMFFPC